MRGAKSNALFLRIADCNPSRPRYVDETSGHGLMHGVLQMTLQMISDRYYNRRDSPLWLVWCTSVKGSAPLRTITYLCYLSACFNFFGPFWFHV